MIRIAWVFACVLAIASFAEGAGATTVARRASQVEPATLDPQKSADGPEQMIEPDLFEGRTAYDAATPVIPGVAESWENAADGLGWTFHPRLDIFPSMIFRWPSIIWPGPTPPPRTPSAVFARMPEK